MRTERMARIAVAGLSAAYTLSSATDAKGIVGPLYGVEPIEAEALRLVRARPTGELAQR